MNASRRPLRVICRPQATLKLRPASPLKADIASLPRYVPLRATNGLVHPQHTASLFDPLLSKREPARREGETQCPGNFRIEDKLEFRGPLDRQIGGLGALEDAVDIIGQAPVGLGNARPVGVQRTTLSEDRPARD